MNNPESFLLVAGSFEGSGVAGCSHAGCANRSCSKPISSAATGHRRPYRRRALKRTPPKSMSYRGRCGSDFMVDVVKSLDIELLCSNPGRVPGALHESVINYGG